MRVADSSLVIGLLAAGLAAQAPARHAVATPPNGADAQEREPDAPASEAKQAAPPKAAEKPAGAPPQAPRPAAAEPGPEPAKPAQGPHGPAATAPPETGPTAPATPEPEVGQQSEDEAILEELDLFLLFELLRDLDLFSEVP
jgi:hypothetical protein